MSAGNGGRFFALALAFALSFVPAFVLDCHPEKENRRESPRRPVSQSIQS
jgi:hypothetical protein